MIEFVSFFIPPWGNKGGLTHNATSYEVYEDLAMTSKLHESLNNSINLNYYETPIVLPPNKTLYTRVKRHFVSVADSELYWLPLKPQISKMIRDITIIPDTEVDQPYIKSIEDLWDNSKTQFTIKLSKYSGITLNYT